MKRESRPEEGLLQRMEALGCPDHSRKLTHLCKEPLCPYQFMCPDCLVTNSDHVRAHRSFFSPLPFIQPLLAQVRAEPLLQKIALLRDQVKSQTASLDSQIEQLAHKVLAAQNALIKRVSQSVQKVVSQLYQFIDSRKAQTSQRLLTVATDAQKLLTQVQIFSANKSQEYESMLCKAQPEYLRLKNLFRRLICQRDDTVHQKTYESLSQLLLSEQATIRDNYLMRLDGFDRVELPLDLNALLPDPVFEKSKFKRLDEIDQLLLAIAPLPPQDAITFVKHFQLSQKPRGLHSQSSDMTFLVRYRKSFQVFGITQAFNKYTKEPKSGLQATIQHLQHEQELQGKIYQKEGNRLFLGTKQGLILSKNLDSGATLALRNSFYRVTSLHYSKPLNLLLAGTQNGWLSGWRTVTNQDAKPQWTARVGSSRVTGVQSTGRFIVCLVGQELLVLKGETRQCVQRMQYKIRSCSSQMPMTNGAALLRAGGQFWVLLAGGNDDRRVGCYLLRD